MGWWLLRLSAKILALLRPSVNFFQLRLTKKLNINFFCFKKLNINTPIQEKTGSCMEARPKGAQTQNGDETTRFLSAK